VRFKRRRSPLRALSIGVLATILAMTVVLSLTVRSAVAGQQRQLLNERAVEAGLVVGSLFQGAASALPTLAADTAPEPGSTARFTAAARSDLGVVGAIGALRQAGGTFTVLAGVGAAPGPGGTVSAGREALASRALGSKGIVNAIVVTRQGPRLSFSLAAGNGVVLYEDLAFDPSKPVNLGSSGPFSELDGTLYASTRPDPSAVVLTTTRLALSGLVSRQVVDVGTMKWLLVAQSRQPLVGSFAARAPWAVLGVGLLAALLGTLLVEILGRRRTYAFDLVAERTSALQEALEEQGRLERGEHHARKAAEAANRAKTEFLSRMSHELRTPLNAVLGFGQLLETDDLSEDQRESVSHILKGGRHLLGLIDEVLDISRIETGNLALSPEPVQVCELVADALALMSPVVQEGRIRVVSDLGAAGSSHVLADRQRLKQVLLNLLSNAIKYNREGGSVTVTCARDGDAWFTITVADTGPGIRAQDLERLFVPFDRLGAEQTEVQGTGVGLALSRGLMEAMRGALQVESSPGQGSRFIARLPLAEGPLEHYERLDGGTQERSRQPRDGSAIRQKVLYIEDNLSNLRLVERVLARRGDVEVIAAMQGGIGLSLAREHRPAVILLDLHLPNMGGEEVLRRIREDPVTEGIPVIVLSADATRGQADRLLAEGADAYLTKPLDVAHLLEVLSEKIDPPAVVQRARSHSPESDQTLQPG